MYSVFHLENILCVVNSQSFDFGGVCLERARGHYVIFTTASGWGPSERDLNRRRKGGSYFQINITAGCHGTASHRALNGGNLCKNVDNETKRT